MQQASRSSLTQNPALLFGGGGALAGLILGIVLGLLFGFNASAAPQHLGEAYAAKYVQAVADSYSLNGNIELAVDRMKDFPDYNEAIGWARQLATANNDQGALDRLQTFEITLNVAASGTEGVLNTGGGGGRSSLVTLGIALLALLLIAGAGIVGWLYFQGRIGGGNRNVRGDIPTDPALMTPAQQGVARAQAAYEAQPAFMDDDDGDLVSRFTSGYVLGDDLFDESFSIDDGNGDFLGECGVGIGETTGVGDPKKVQTFEIWLFDKNDIRTVTHVLMSEHAYMDEALKSKLAAKGTPTLAQPNAELKLETASLEVRARILDMQYGSGPLPPNSFFQQLTIELRAYKKPGATDAGGDGFNF